jgi:hypothetical protein
VVRSGVPLYVRPGEEEADWGYFNEEEYSERNYAAVEQWVRLVFMVLV